MISIIMTTVNKRSEARKIAEQLVLNKLAACVQVVDRLESIYHWNSRIQKSKEYLVIVKTSSKKKRAAAKFIEKSHPYDLPEIILMNGAASKLYRNWVDKETS